MEKRLTFIEAKQIPIIDFLERWGHSPVRTVGHDQWYHSPFRDERTPSFKVNTKLNVWYDHGTGDGGTIIDLGARMYNCSLYDFLQKLSNEEYYPVVSISSPPVNEPINKLEVLAVKSLEDPGLLQYLNERCIEPDIAKHFCFDEQLRQT